MKNSDTPPGVSASDIPGNRPEDAAWEALHEMIDSDADRHGMCDMDAHVAWKLGVSAFLAARSYGALYEHDAQGAGKHD